MHGWSLWYQVCWWTTEQFISLINRSLTSETFNDQKNRRYCEVHENYSHIYWSSFQGYGFASLGPSHGVVRVDKRIPRSPPAMQTCRLGPEARHRRIDGDDGFLFGSFHQPSMGAPPSYHFLMRTLRNKPSSSMVKGYPHLSGNPPKMGRRHKIANLELPGAVFFKRFDDRPYYGGRFSPSGGNHIFQTLRRWIASGRIAWIVSTLQMKSSNSTVVKFGSDSVLTFLSNPNWLVVHEPLWKIWVRQLGWWHSQYMGK